MNESYWILSSKNNKYNKLEEDIEIDCLIVGGGIAGLTTAYLLAKENKKVVILEASQIGYGASGRNTGKITSQQGLIYTEISKKHSLENARLYYEANEEGLNLVKNIIKEHNIDCNFKLVSGYTYTQNEKYVKDIEEEYETCKELNIPCNIHNKVEGIPLEINKAISFDNQGQFNPKKYVDALAQIDKCLGVEIYENTSVVDVQVGEVCEVRCANNSIVRAKNLIIASSNAWYDGLMLYFSKEEASRSYLLSAKLNEPILEGNYINVEKPTRTFRTYTDDDGNDYIIAGGQDHKTGKCNNEGESFEIIKDFAEETFEIDKIETHWSTQDYVSFDKIPYIGRVNKKSNNVYIITGTSKWGLSNTSIGSVIIKDLITKNESKYKELYNPSRLKSYINVKYLENSIEVAYDYIKGKFAKGNSNLPDKKDEGKVVNINGKNYGAYMNKNGELFVVDITCTHLGCELRFNSAEKSWDCPCHGSRFNYKGEILNGPALKPLKRYGLGNNDVSPKLI